MSTLSGNTLFTGIQSGLTSTYSLIAGQYSGGVTLENIQKARTNSSLTSSLNQTFATYLQSNFSSLDKDGDGIISSAEMNNLSTSISSKGLTAAQLSQLGTASGLSTNALEKVLENFSQIDANGDGKVTTAEISAYNVKSQMEKKKIEFANKEASSQSVFYGDDSSSSASSSDSLVAYKYMDDTDNTSSDS